MVGNYVQIILIHVNEIKINNEAATHFFMIRPYGVNVLKVCFQSFSL